MAPLDQKSSGVVGTWRSTVPSPAEHVLVITNTTLFSTLFALLPHTQKHLSFVNSNLSFAFIYSFCELALYLLSVSIWIWVISNSPTVLCSQHHIFKATLNPGDALLIPVGWWHEVLSLSTSISIGITGLLFENRYVEYHPAPLGSSQSHGSE